MLLEEGVVKLVQNLPNVREVVHTVLGEFAAVKELLNFLRRILAPQTMIVFLITAATEFVFGLAIVRMTFSVTLHRPLRTTTFRIIRKDFAPLQFPAC